MKALFLAILALSITCSAFAFEFIDQEKLADSIYLAEGGPKAKIPYGILSVNVRDEAEARRACINTIRNNIARWHWAVQQGDKRGFIEYLGSRYCPIGAENDPRGLNNAWVGNVSSLYDKALLRA